MNMAGTNIRTEKNSSRTCKHRLMYILLPDLANLFLFLYLTPLKYTPKSWSLSKMCLVQRVLWGCCNNIWVI